MNISRGFSSTYYARPSNLPVGEDGISRTNLCAEITDTSTLKSSYPTPPQVFSKSGMNGHNHLNGSGDPAAGSAG